MTQPLDRGWVFCYIVHVELKTHAQSQSFQRFVWQH